MPPRLRAPLLALGAVSLVFALAGGLARLTPWLPAPGTAIGWHGALMVSAFLGSVVSLERAAALGRPWGYLAPLCAGAGGIALLAGAARAGLALAVAAAALFAACSAALMRRQRSLETGTLLAGALAWLIGNAALAQGAPPHGWWVAFFVLTIGAERLELSRYLKRSAFSRRAFVALAAGVLLAPLEPALRAQGALLALFAAWLLRYDLARVTVRGRGLPRFVAVCLLAGYFWLAVAGALLLLHGPRDAALHALFVGFVFSMIFGHAPVILPAVLGVRVPYGPALYAPLALLHASLAVRVAYSAPLGAWGNAAAIVLFLGSAALLALRRT
ncbi:MAG TPA: hypothetical protein VF211_11195 [Burkholderiales bacterium]